KLENDMKYLLFLWLALLCPIQSANAAPPSIGQQISEKKLRQSPKRTHNFPKFRWKRIFRPLMVGNKRWSQRMLWIGILSVVFWGSFLFASFRSLNNTSSGEGQDIALGGLALILVTEGLLAIGMILLVPVVFIIRLLREIRWHNRYRKCPKPKRSKIRDTKTKD
ncbi:MAG: hypothetical protein AAFO94_09520, partial [Bacteroidota bacterium]